ncbi:P1 family peptidase [Streptomyces sp. LHD-70]|uniref:P1 family peptidase n=1 Tax=Streptomyces sp. LHD-70 TaxID=3072140 RepID=UPI00280D4E55|nr:P1 family peptidase [Streptomyces sp. LHD-70]MDQ8706794.1 P1 family peptidase [Streptomyces sp. LHD-70]
MDSRDSASSSKTTAGRIGGKDSLTDVPGLRVGHATRDGGGWLTGTTVVLAPTGGAVAAVDVRGGGPGTRETDALDPRNLVQRIDAVVLTGGSAYGLDAAAGVMAWLEEQGRGVPVGGPDRVVPVVPAACLFDLGRGGDWRARPTAVLGREAVERATAEVAQGSVGAGTGAVAGGMKGGVGTASVRLESGHTVGALVVVNAVGSVTDPKSGVLYGRYFEDGDSTEPVERPAQEVHARAQARLAEAQAETARRQNGGGEPSIATAGATGRATGQEGATGPAGPGGPGGSAGSAGSAGSRLNTTLAVVATDAGLSRAQAQKLAGTSHDGFARAIRPVHLLHDGDTVFTLATGEYPLPEGELEQMTVVNAILAAGADTVTRAIVRAIEAAETVDSAGGLFPSYGDLYGDLEDLYGDLHGKE